MIPHILVGSLIILQQKPQSVNACIQRFWGPCAPCGVAPRGYLELCLGCIVETEAPLALRGAVC